MRVSPGALVFGRDMFVDVPLVADLLAIRQRRELLINQNLMRENQKRYEYHHRVGDLVIIKVYNPTKLQEMLHRPYPIVECRTNGTVRVQRGPAGAVIETYNIRKVVPYKGPPLQNQINP